MSGYACPFTGSNHAAVLALQLLARAIRSSGGYPDRSGG
jgi:hypothetical protein